MEIVGQKVKDIGSVKFDAGGKYEDYFKRFLDGDRASNYDQKSMDYRGLGIVQNKLGPLVDNGVTKDIIEKVYKGSLMGGDLVEGVKDLGGSTRSAYDALVGKSTDCDSDAQVYSAVFDSLGFNTAIVAGTGHADVIIQLNGKWFKALGGTFREANISATLSDGSHVHTQPTTGPSL
jgi:hypothetical protein